MIFTKNTAFNESLIEVLKKVNLLDDLDKELVNPTLNEFGETQWSAKVVGDNSHFVISPIVDPDVSGIKFEIIYHREKERKATMVFCLDGEICYYENQRYSYDDDVIRDLLYEFATVLKLQYQNPKVSRIS